MRIEQLNRLNFDGSTRRKILINPIIRAQGVCYGFGICRKGAGQQ